jgi:hypothetical protein
MLHMLLLYVARFWIFILHMLQLANLPGSTCRRSAHACTRGREVGSIVCLLYVGLVWPTGAFEASFRPDI